MNTTNQNQVGEDNAPRAEWNGDGPQIRETVLSDGSKVYDVILEAETIFCRDTESAIQLIADLNRVVEAAQ